jgi:methylmalonyl-CoA/ethylmalonyl-CoA epimerase
LKVNLPAHNPSFSFHHVGVAVANLQQAAAFYSSAFGFEMVSGPFEDPIQKVAVCFLARSSDAIAPLELISPLVDTCPINNYLKKEIGAYHLCYEVADISRTLAHLRANKCLIIGKPVPAVAFNGRKIAWCYTPTNQLVELIDTGKPD